MTPVIIQRLTRRVPAILRAPVGIGAAIDVLAVLAGSSIGTLAGANFPEGMHWTAMQTIGIVTLLVGV
jgi:uncharacterized membrane protein YqgA involved in biofilm formation